MGLLHGSSPGGPWGRDVLIGCLCVLQELDVPLLALERADGVASVLAVEVSGAPAAHAPSELAARDALLVQNREVVELSRRRPLLVALLSGLRRRRDHVEWHRGLFLEGLLGQLGGLFRAALSLSLELFEGVLAGHSDLLDLRLVEAHVVDQVSQGDVGVLLLGSEGDKGLLHAPRCIYRPSEDTLAVI